MSNNNQHVWLWSTLVFLLMFGPKFSAFVDVIPITCFIVIMAKLLTSMRMHKTDSAFMLIIIYALYSLLILSLYNVYDQWHIFQPWRAAINYLGIVLVVIMLDKQGWSWRQVLSLVNMSIYAHSAIVIVTFLVPDLRHAITDLTGFVEKSYLRSSGLTNSYGITSIVTVMPFLMVAFTKGSLYKPKYDYIGLAIVFISLFLLARIGLYLLPFLVFAVFWKIALYKKIRFTHYIGVFIIIVATSSLYWLNQLGIFQGTNDSDNVLFRSLVIFFNESVYHSLELIRSISQGEGSVQSLETVGGFVYHNNTALEYLFGTGQYGRGNELYHLETDISYAHYFSMVGIFGLALMILAHIFPYISYFKASHALRYIFMIIVLVILVGNYKEATFFTRNLFSLWSFVAACLYVDHFRHRFYRIIS